MILLTIHKHVLLLLNFILFIMRFARIAYEKITMSLMRAMIVFPLMFSRQKSISKRLHDVFLLK